MTNLTKLKCEFARRYYEDGEVERFNPGTFCDRVILRRRKTHTLSIAKLRNVFCWCKFYLICTEVSGHFQSLNPEAFISGDD